MPIIETLADLFRSGASFVAEQYVRGRSKSASLVGLLSRKFGPNLTAPIDVIGVLEDRTRLASIPANEINRQGLIDVRLVPKWGDPSLTSGYVHSGLAKVGVPSATGGDIFTTHIPFNFHEQEIKRLAEIEEKIRKAFDASPEEIQEKYQADINRIDNIIRFHRLMGLDITVEPEVYGVYVGEGEVR